MISKDGEGKLRKCFENLILNFYSNVIFVRGNARCSVPLMLSNLESSGCPVAIRELSQAWWFAGSCKVYFLIYFL